MSPRVERLCVVAILALLALIVCGCTKSATSRETAVQTPDHTGRTWYEPVKGAR